MSERDPRFNPKELLKNASDDDTSNSEEQEALHMYHSLVEKMHSEAQKLLNLRDFVNSKSSAFSGLTPDIQDGILRQLDAQEENVNQLTRATSEMAWDNSLRPIVDKVYSRVIEEDVKEAEEEYITEMNRKSAEISERWRKQHKAYEAKHFEERYENFVSTHKNNIISELQFGYDKFRSKLVSGIDFGGHVCLPLFAVWAFSLLLLPRPVKTIIIVFVSGIFIGLAFWLHHYFNSVIDNICRKYFEECEYKNIIILYVRRCKNGSISKANSQTEIDDISTFFESCEEKIVDEYFHYR